MYLYIILVHASLEEHFVMKWSPCLNKDYHTILYVAWRNNKWVSGVKDAGYEVLATRRLLCLMKAVVSAVFIQNVCVVEGDRIKVRGEEVRIHIIVVIFVNREMFRDLTGFLLLSLGGQVCVCEFACSHKSLYAYTEQNFDQIWSMKKPLCSSKSWRKLPCSLESFCREKKPRRWWKSIRKTLQTKA